MLVQPTLENIININKQVIYVSGGIHGIRDHRLIESSINAPFQTFSGQDLYPEVEEKAARVAFGLAMNHPFLDGNKRTALITLLTFLKCNKIEFNATQDNMLNLIVNLSSGESSYSTFLDLIYKYAQR